MEQTLLPDRVSEAKIMTKNTQQNTLTSASFRVIDVSAKNNQEVQNANSRQESERRDQTNREISQATLQMRGSGSRGQAPLPPGGQAGVQEPISAAGMAITGHPCDGWVFWSVQNAGDASTTEVQQTETQPASTPEVEAGGTAEQVQTPEQTAVIFFKMEWQRAVPKGQTRWHCNVCKKHFLAPTGETPQTCPQGHKAS